MCQRLSTKVQQRTFSSWTSCDSCESVHMKPLSDSPCRDGISVVKVASYYCSKSPVTLQAGPQDVYMYQTILCSMCDYKGHPVMWTLSWSNSRVDAMPSITLCEAAQLLVHANRRASLVEQRSLVTPNPKKSREEPERVPVRRRVPDGSGASGLRCVASPKSPSTKLVEAHRSCPT